MVITMSHRCIDAEAAAMATFSIDTQLFKSGQQFRSAVFTAFRPEADLNMRCLCFQCAVIKG